MKSLENIMKLLKIVVISLLFGMLVIGGVNLYVVRVGKAFFTIQPNAADAVIVPGASVRGNRVSDTLAKRLDTAYELYHSGISQKIIVSGDHGTEDYNEVRAMRKYLMDKGIPQEDIFMDHAGFSTYDTVYRAKDIFLVETAVIVSQEEHLLRALYIARELGLSAQGVSAGKYLPAEQSIQVVREVLARVKAFLQCEIFHSEPVFLGEPIPVNELSGNVTDDERMEE